MQFTSHLKIGDDTAEKLKNTFKGVFAVIDILKEALRLALSDKTYCRDCELNTSCGSEKCFKFRMDEVLKEAKQNLEETQK